MSENETGIPPRLEPVSGLRILAGLFGFPILAWGLFCLTAFVAGLVMGKGIDPLSLCLGLAATVFGFLPVNFALKGNRSASRRRIWIAFMGGMVLGGIGFAGGFFGPMMLTPDANQGPLLGIFITGPAGFVLGTALGWVYASTRKN